MKDRIAEFYKQMTTAELLAEVETRRWDMADLDAGGDPLKEAGIAFHLALLEAGVAELRRRERLRRNRFAPPWPTRWPDRRPDAKAIKAAVSVADFATGYLGADLRPSGSGRLIGRCPLPAHDDDRPSFVVYPGDRGFHCFGCGVGGDLFTLAQHALGEPRFGAVLAEIARWAGLAPEGAA